MEIQLYNDATVVGEHSKVCDENILDYVNIEHFMKIAQPKTL